jgi:hypothetical protein
LAESAYATTTDLGTYLESFDQTANATIATTLLSYASRLIDEKCGQYFYDDGSSTKYFDGDGTRYLDVDHPFFSLSNLTIAHFENEALANWYSATADESDGITPPSNFWLFPRNPQPIGNTASGGLRPYWGIDMAQIPKTATNWPPVFFPGNKTVGITAHFGWAQVPDLVKNITLKITARAWRARGAGWADTIGSPDVGVQTISKFWDHADFYVLNSSGLVHVGF